MEFILALDLSFKYSYIVEVLNYNLQGNKNRKKAKGC